MYHNNIIHVDVVCMHTLSDAILHHSLAGPARWPEQEKEVYCTRIYVRIAGMKSRALTTHVSIP